jgi:hypothetical protein
MSSLAEIELAADSLSPEEEEELLRFLAIRLRKQRLQTAPRICSDEELAAMLAEDERLLTRKLEPRMDADERG